MPDYVIAIPSYQREKTIKLRTLNTLKKYKIPKKIIYIFVANEKEKKIYCEHLDKGYHKNIIIGELGVKNIRMFMSNYFKEGQKICYIDDDVYAIEEAVFNAKSKKKLKEKLKLKKLKETPENIKIWKKSCQIFVTLKSLDKFLTEGFNVLKKSKHKLFGINPVYNPFFCTIKDKKNSHITYNLKYIVGALCGVINSKKAEIRHVHDKEDYERSIRYYLLTGGTPRFNNISIVTKYYKEPGGLQSLGHRSWVKVDKSAKFLLDAYPKLSHLNTRKKKKDPKTNKPWTEIVLRDKREKKIFGKIPKINKKLIKTLEDIIYV
jgi:hypothetical protein